MAIAARKARTDPPQPVAEDKKKGRSTASTAANGADKDDAKFSAIPAGIDFWDWLSQFSATDWNCLIGYLWRTAPLVNSRAAARTTHIKKYANAFDMERIALEEGSGGYRIDLVYCDPASAKQNRIAQHYFEIMNMNYPPKVPYGDWLLDPANDMWKWCEPMLKAKQAEIASEAAAQTAHANAAAPPQDANSLFNTVLSGIRTLRGDSQENQGLAATVLEMVQANQQKMMELSDPVKQLGTLKELLKAITPPEDKSGNVIIEILRDELRSTREELKDMRKEATKAANSQAPSKSIIEEILDNAPKIRELAKMLGFTPGAGNGTDWGAVAVQAIDKLADNVPLIVEGFRNRGSAPGAGGVGGWPTSISPRGTGTAKQPAAETKTETPQTDATADSAESELPAEEKKRLQAILNKYGQTINAIAPFLIDQYKAEDRKSVV